MSQKAVRFTTRCPECREPAQIPGEDLLTNPDVPVRCGKCGTAFNASLVPGATQPARMRPAPPEPVEKPREKAVTRPEPPRREKLAAAEPLPFPDLVPVREETARDEVSVPFAPVGSGRSQASGQLRPVSASVGVPFAPAGGNQPAKGGFNSLPPWKQYTILVLLIVIAGVAVFLAPIGEGGGKADEEDDRQGQEQVDQPRAKKPTRTEEPVDLEIDVPKGEKSQKPEDKIPKIPIKIAD